MERQCIHKEAPRYLEEFFKIKICNNNLRGSGTLLTLPNFNLEWRHKSFSFLAAKLQNSLPMYVRNAKDISSFKCLSKKQVCREIRMVTSKLFLFFSTFFVSRTFLSLLVVAWVNKVLYYIVLYC